MYVYLIGGGIDVIPSVSRTEITCERVILFGAIDGLVAAEYPRRDVYCAGDTLMSPAF